MTAADRQMARRLADGLLYSSALSLALMAAVFLALPVFVQLAGPELFLWPLFAASFFAALGLSVYLLLDAVLFRMISSYNDLASGLKAADVFLRRSALREDADEGRSFADRMAGTHKLLNYQRASMLLFLALFAVMAAL